MDDNIGFENALRHDIVYHCLTPDPAQALVFGGGATGGTVHTPDDSLYLLLSRSDLWNEKAGMGAIAAVRVRGTAGLFSQAQPVKQVCSVGNASVELRLGDEVRIVLTCLCARDLLVVDITDARQTPGPWTVILENWHGGDSPPQPRPRPDRDAPREPGQRVRRSRTKPWGVDAAALGLCDPLLGRAWGLWIAAGRRPGQRRDARPASVRQPPDTHRHRLRGPSGRARRRGGKPRRRGRTLVVASPATLDAWFVEHRAWWRAFWGKSYLSLRSGTGEAE